MLAREGMGWRAFTPAPLPQLADFFLRTNFRRSPPAGIFGKTIEMSAAPTDQPDDATLRVQQLFVQHQAALRGFVLSLLPDFAAAEDVVQETFLTVSRKAQDFELGTNFPAWARRIAMNHALHQRRRFARGPVALSDDVLEALVAAAPEESPEERQTLLVLLRGCLEKLAPTARELVRMRYYGEHAPQQIAEQRGLSAKGVNVTLSRARTQLRACMEHRLRAAEGRA